ncbi:MAG: hypothetical protein HFI76_05350 [Lachnospiraceae bacterium]|jgi:hypothetical protein|nr:hypothetical protein [Lachnospiraceae bacterium]
MGAYRISGGVTTGPITVPFIMSSVLVLLRFEAIRIPAAAVWMQDGVINSLEGAGSMQQTMEEEAWHEYGGRSHDLLRSHRPNAKVGIIWRQE